MKSTRKVLLKKTFALQYLAILCIIIISTALLAQPANAFTGNQNTVEKKYATKSDSTSQHHSNTQSFAENIPKMKYKLNEKIYTKTKTTPTTAFHPKFDNLRGQIAKEIWSNAISSIPDASIYSNITEKEAFVILQAFYQSLGGWNWKWQDGWLNPDVPICEWWGIICQPPPESNSNHLSYYQFTKSDHSNMAVDRTQKSQLLHTFETTDFSQSIIDNNMNNGEDDTSFTAIISISMPSNNLVGEIPPELCQLTSLKMLDLGQNNITGYIPYNFGDLSSLMLLDLADNQLKGLLPFSMEKLVDLGFIDISSNLLEGPIPDGFWMMKSVRLVDISKNLFQEPLNPLIGKMTSLQQLHLSHNKFNGPLPVELGIHSLVQLDISHNEFSGEILPNMTSHLLKLQTFVASSNRLNGSTYALGYLSQIRNLFVDHNLLSGELHPYLYSMEKSLALDFSHNLLSGVVSEDLLRRLLGHPNLLYLNLMSNKGLVSYLKRIPAFLEIDPHITSHVNMGPFFCHRLFLGQGPATSILVDPSFFWYLHCSCVRDSYGTPPDECYQCPPGATCDGGKTFTFDAGWYPIMAPVNQSSTKPNSKKIAPFSHPERILPPRRKPVLVDAPHGHRMISSPPKDFTAGPIVLWPCPDLQTPNSACNPLGNGTFFYESNTTYGITPQTVLCQPGYGKRLCSFCECFAAENPQCTREGPLRESEDCACFYRSGLKCNRCKSVWKRSSLIALLSGIYCSLILFMAFIFYCRKVPSKASPLRFEFVNRIFNLIPSETRHSGYLKILLFHLQTLSAVTKDPILNWLKLSNGEFAGLGGICIWPLLADPYWQHLTYLLLPIILNSALLLALFIAAGAASLAEKYITPEVMDEDYVNDHLIYGAGADFNIPPYDKPKTNNSSSNSDYSLVIQGLSVSLTIFWWFLFGIAFKMFAVFNCSSDPLSSFLETQPWLTCSSSQYHSLRMASIIGIIFYIGVIPLLFGILLFVFRQRVQEPGIRDLMQILCESYRNRVFWYEMIVTARRFCLAAVLALVPLSSAFKMTSVILVLLGGLYLQIMFQPFKTKLENVMEELCMVTVVLTFAAQFTFNVQLAQTQALNVTTVVCNSILIVFVLYTYLSRTFLPHFKYMPWSKKASDDQSMDTIEPADHL